MHRHILGLALFEPSLELCTSCSCQIEMFVLLRYWLLMLVSVPESIDKYSHSVTCVCSLGDMQSMVRQSDTNIT